MTVSTPERADLVLVISDLLTRLDELGGSERSYINYMDVEARKRRDNCNKVRRKLFEALDESGNANA